MSKVLVLYPNQLFMFEYLPKDVERVLLVEEPLLFGNDEQYPSSFHRQKLVMHRASMRRYVGEVLWPAGFEVDYVEHHTLKRSEGIADRLEDAEELVIFDVVDDILRRRLSAVCAETHKKLTWLDNPNFFLKRSEVQAKFQGSGIPKFASFYQWQRERFNILLTAAYKPAGGRLMHDAEGVRRVPQDQPLPTFAVFGDNDFVREAVEYVNKHFPDSYGALNQAPWPTSHQEADKWLHDFIETRLENSGNYRDSIDPNAPWLFHGALSAPLNIGLLSPQQILSAALERHAEKKLPLTSLEPLVRDILGWREYYRGLYESQQTALRTGNRFDNDRLLTDDWYAATTGLPPLDYAIRNLFERAYVHEAERTDVIGAAMLMSGINPKAVYQYFNELMIDGYDWISVPRVFGFSQCSDGGSLAGVIPLYNSSNLLARSHYEDGGWCDIWDGLYAKFIEDNEKILNSNPNMRVVVSAVKRMNQDRRRIIGYRAEDFLASKTFNS